MAKLETNVCIICGKGEYQFLFRQGIRLLTNVGVWAYLSKPSYTS